MCRGALDPEFSDLAGSGVRIFGSHLG